MANHTKPSPEELEANIKKSLEDLDNLETKPNVEESETEKEEVVAETDGGDNPEPTETEEEVTEEKEEEEKEENGEDYKERFKESTREAQILHNKNEKLSKAVIESSKVSEPTQEEIIAEYPDWDVMSETEQKLAKKALIADKRLRVLDEIAKDTQDASVWNAKVDQFVDDPKVLIANPDLEGKEEEFRIFASKKSRRGVDFEILVSSFLYDVSKTVKKHKGAMFEKSNGGRSAPTKSDGKLSVQQGRVLMQSNYNEYRRLLKAGKIANE